MKKRHGVAASRKLRRRLSDLRAAQSLEEMRDLPGKCHELRDDREGQLAVTVSGGKRLIFKPDPPQRKGKGVAKLNWTDVSGITIIEIVDYHD